MTHDITLPFNVGSSGTTLTHLQSFFSRSGDIHSE